MDIIVIYGILFIYDGSFSMWEFNTNWVLLPGSRGFDGEKEIMINDNLECGNAACGYNKDQSKMNAPAGPGGYLGETSGM